MDRIAKVAWSEGMLLRPQHFQQQDRFLYQVARNRHTLTAMNRYGISLIESDAQALGLGQVSLVKVSGIFPDGMPFSFDQTEELVLEIPKDARDELVYLVLPMEKLAGTNVAADSGTQGARYRFEEVSLLDDSAEDGEEEQLGLANLNPRLKL